jgi:putative solute:sodium symporter small subunit
MKENPEDYHISFFKPTTNQARFNKGLVLWLVSIWFIAIFGFHILLRIIEQPTPEPPLIAFNEVWEDVSNGTATAEQTQKVGQASLYVLSKIAITPEERTLLSQTMSWSLIQQFPDTVQTNVKEKFAKFESLKESIADINDPEYLESKQKLSKKLSPKLGLTELDARIPILPIELTGNIPANMPQAVADELPAILEKYMIHNRSVLTDTKFLGFPFHYFYSAVFLLILFIGLCWLYCIRIDHRNLKLGIED